MKEPIVSDSTCLIGLEKIEQLDLIQAFFELVLFPPKVHHEFGISFPWLEIKNPTNPAFVNTLKMLVDDGEAEAIALAQERGFGVILDDRKARLVARNLGVTVIGTVGIVVLAKRHSLVTSVKDILGKLEANGFFLSKSLREEALRLADE